LGVFATESATAVPHEVVVLLGSARVTVAEWFSESATAVPHELVVFWGSGSARATEPERFSESAAAVPHEVVIFWGSGSASMLERPSRAFGVLAVLVLMVGVTVTLD
jgi:hypothetical protein